MPENQPKKSLGFDLIDAMREAVAIERGAAEPALTHRVRVLSAPIVHPSFGHRPSGNRAPSPAVRATAWSTGHRAPISAQVASAVRATRPGKIGCAAETVRLWVRQAERIAGSVAREACSRWRSAVSATSTTTRIDTLEPGAGDRHLARQSISSGIFRAWARTCDLRRRRPERTEGLRSPATDQHARLTVAAFPWRKPCHRRHATRRSSGDPFLA